MIKKLLVFTLFLGFALTAHSDGYVVKCAAVNDNQPVESPFKGQWSGEWTATPTVLGYFEDGAEEHTGTMDISVETDGDITGTVNDKTAGTQGTIKGFIDENGAINLSVKYRRTYTVKGTLQKRGIRLIGRLTQFCDREPCVNFEITFKRKE